jgi:hypothetical protein
MKRLSHRGKRDIKTYLAETQLDGCSQIYVAADSAKFMLLVNTVMNTQFRKTESYEFVDQVNFSFSRKTLHQ